VASNPLSESRKDTSIIVADTQMKYRRIGRAGMQVSEVSLGSWLTYGGAVEEDTAEKCIRKAYELGINFFDTANVYMRGEAEKVVGRVLKDYERDTLVVATKVFFPMREGPNGGGLSRKHIREQCHLSLKRLGMDYVDLYQCHRWDANTPVEETILAMEDLVKEGKILYYGVSEWSAAQIAAGLHVAKSRGLYGMVSNQPYYNMIGRKIEAEVIPLSEEQGIGQVVFSPLAQGVLTGKYKPGEQPPKDSRAADPKQNMFMVHGDLMSDANLEKVQRLVLIAEKLGCSMSQLALAWILRLPNISSVIIGASKPQQVEDNAGSVNVTLDGDILADIEEILTGKTEE
jgi:voltage-dependent potassium channel beta subunit